jgi:hypothetical protein
LFNLIRVEYFHHKLVLCNQIPTKNPPNLVVEVASVDSDDRAIRQSLRQGALILQQIADDEHCMLQLVKSHYFVDRLPFVLVFEPRQLFREWFIFFAQFFSLF